MNRLINTLITVVLVTSCNSNDSKSLEAKIEHQEKTSAKSVADIIQERFPSDSIKVRVIVDLMQGIDADTHKVMVRIVDSTDKVIGAYYKNDALIKIVEGYQGRYVSSHARNEYYFFMNRLIALKYQCSNIQNTGMCNPVWSTSVFYYYNDKIISETHSSEIGGYVYCGCADLSKELPFNYRKYYFKNINVRKLKAHIQRFK